MTRKIIFSDLFKSLGVFICLFLIKYDVYANINTNSRQISNNDHLVKLNQKLIHLVPDEHSSSYCSYFSDCQSCLKDHISNVLNTSQNVTNCKFKVCYLSGSRSQFFSICYAQDNEAICPANLTESHVIDNGAKCIEVVNQRFSDESNNTTVTPINNSTTTAITASIAPLNPNGTTSISNTTVTSPLTPTNATTTSTASPTTTTSTSTNTTLPNPTNQTTSPTNSNVTTSSTQPSGNVTYHPTPAPNTGGGGHVKSAFSFSSFIAGVFVTLGISSVAFFAMKYYRNNIRYRQF